MSDWADNYTLQICFEGDEDKAWFLADRIPSGIEVGGEAMAIRQQVETFVASEPKLSELVSSYYELCDMSEEAVEASRR